MTLVGFTIPSVLSAVFFFFFPGLGFPKGQEVVWKRDPSMLGAWHSVVPGAGEEMVQKILSRVFLCVWGHCGFCVSAVGVTQGISLE